MKKLIKYFLIIVIIIIAMPSKQSGLEDLIKPFNVSNISNIYYTTDNIDIPQAKEIYCGSAVFVECDIYNCKQVKKKLSNIQGQSISFEGDEELYNMLVCNLMNIKINQSVNNIKTCYGYNAEIGQSVIIDNIKINMQIAYNNNKITIGTPVILGSY